MRPVNCTLEHRQHVQLWRRHCGGVLVDLNTFQKPMEYLLIIVFWDGGTDFFVADVEELSIEELAQIVVRKNQDLSTSDPLYTKLVSTDDDECLSDPRLVVISPHEVVNYQPIKYTLVFRD